MVQVIKMENYLILKIYTAAKDPKELSPLVLAETTLFLKYLYVQSPFEFGNAPVNKMHKRSRKWRQRQKASQICISVYKIY